MRARLAAAESRKEHVSSCCPAGHVSTHHHGGDDLATVLIDPFGGGTPSTGIAISNVEVQVLKMNPGWKVSIRRCFGYSERSNRHPLIYNEQDVLNNLGDANAMSIINGGTWTSVLYRVQLPNQSRAVVVKKLQNEGGNAEYAGLTNQCQSEVNLLGSIHHNNIISLEDCFRESNFIVLVYNHKENGSLYQWLHNPADPPSWVHRGGFWTGRRGGASPLVPLKGSTTCTMDATTPSCTTTSTLPAYCLTLTSRPRSHASISHRSALPDMTSRCQSTSPLLSTCLATQLQVDVYSFGVVLPELVTGRVANKAIVDGHLAAWAGRHCNGLMENAGDFSGIVDMAIPDRARYLKEMAAVFKLGVDCTVKEPQERPSMHEVLYRLRNRGR
ncbi:hypothetical protein BRADI_3g16758v3 [Brachypodium distachyon]|uniref:non-specific serine/threonine protein kinase n=1 Tax=Brachypodium distachyon TaxID=15368 RepID=A0A2K2CXM0_BRADI|nr:hypothetical protein BRADI_3g16758v3 [Brachypodium distachyon]